MTRRLARRLVIAAAVSMFAVGAAAVPAAAIPPVGPNQSVTYTYYSNSSKTVIVGGWSYGYCGEPFEWGQRTSYYTIRYVTC